MVRKQLGLYYPIEPDVPVSLNGDPMRLQQVISNLLSSISLRIGCIVLHVRCIEFIYQHSRAGCGVGIPAKEVVRLFVPSSVGTGVQRNFQGTGQGLAICEKLISMMDGDISVDSGHSMGSQFTLRIPLYGAQYPVKRAWKDSPEPAVGWRCAILLCAGCETGLARSGVRHSVMKAEPARTIF